MNETNVTKKYINVITNNELTFAEKERYVNSLNEFDLREIAMEMSKFWTSKDDVEE